jgi:uncharacterized membrane protein YjjP (DUF1212 family)
MHLTASPAPRALPIVKPPLDHDTLRDVIDLALWTGQMLLISGAQSARVERTVHQVGTALGADWLDVVVQPEYLIVTTVSGEEFRTRVRRVVASGVNLARIDAINALARGVVEGEIDRIAYRAALRQLDTTPHLYPGWLVAIMIGLGCAAFSRLFGGDWATFAVTFAAAGVAMRVRQALQRAHFNPLLIVIATAFVAGLVPGLAALVGILPHPETALAASVLLLVPGAALINAARDILRGYTLTGTARGIGGLVTSLCIALGLLVALRAAGVAELGQTPPLPRPLPELLALDAVWSGVAAVCFGVLFNVPRRYLVACALVGAAGHALRAGLAFGGVALTLGTLLGAVTIGLLSEGLARLFRCPAGMFAVPGAIPMVPGVFAFRAMLGVISLTSAPHSDPALLVETVHYFALTGLVLATLSAGIALPSLLLNRARPVV